MIVGAFKIFDSEIRDIVETNVDNVLKDPKRYEKIFGTFLLMTGIEPNLETLLSYLIGYWVGLVDSYFFIKYRRFMNVDQRDELIKILKRRAWELRQAFMRSRIEDR